ncbi:hypothetical protein BC939DRAFT_462277 [Gamsiella multidivaricata]|uniref:uncharacterized protein n=1 Tax=Gamsiella multidivaricata TaxID=101098 RepID=UPI00221FF44D|nr:uncharacterized protein BC939DRAFT_462277 [Gamsiella multidivaricata]KAI7818739.1 hypothetical protein BC939DRAFT_462277 [Gamsiella multidivaricata]
MRGICVPCAALHCSAVGQVVWSHKRCVCVYICVKLCLGVLCGLVSLLDFSNLSHPLPPTPCFDSNAFCVIFS